MGSGAKPSEFPSQSCHFHDALPCLAQSRMGNLSPPHQACQSPGQTGSILLPPAPPRQGYNLSSTHETDIAGIRPQGKSPRTPSAPHQECLTAEAERWEGEQVGTRGQPTPRPGPAWGTRANCQHEELVAMWSGEARQFGDPGTWQRAGWGPRAGRTGCWEGCRGEGRG